MLDINSIRNKLISKYDNNEFVIDKTGVKTIEILNTSFIADEDSIFGKPNEEYIKRELEWYLSQSRNVKDIPEKTPEIWEKVSSSKGLINSNYGYLVYSDDNGNQYQCVLNELKNNPDSRRAEMIYTNPNMHIDYKVDGMNDFVCTEVVQYVIRNNKLHTIVKMRSNDAIYGYPNDLAWQKYVRNQLISDLNVEPGLIYWNAGSFHIYEKHFYYLK